jgi:hypothetical protein
MINPLRPRLPGRGARSSYLGVDTPSRRPTTPAKGWSAPAFKPRLLNVSQWRSVRRQLADVDDELRRLAMREHETRR